MKTPYAILIGLALITAALFYREPSVAPAQAGVTERVIGFECVETRAGLAHSGGCYILHGNSITYMERDNGWEKPLKAEFRGPGVKLRKIKKLEYFPGGSDN